MTEHQAFLKRDMHLALYGMFLCVSNTQPDVRLEWYDILGVELGAEEMEDWLATC